ncbi:hypothetical protein FNV43_RR16248 [Rhamnella rubrinervis]|uniref:Fe2OG dioxygenase domain-containing protein n=1 Tax=Rhamnella rubrinervis TaxID=2594499 RepID=A0A8K0GV14_9ROSA|nr:hypothetical protein FNV43_RR16248 [Rhamnella rubrinervis]
MGFEKESSGNRYGSSLPVPSVQELAREPNLTVPSRYLRPDHHGLSVPDDHDLHDQIPVIDFHKLISAESSTASDELEKLHLYLMNITAEEVEGFGQAFVVSEQQKLDWNDIFFLTTLPLHMRKPHLFPELLSPFRENLDMYSMELKNLAMGLIGQMEKALNVKDKEVIELFEGGLQAIRMNYYPPCPQPEKVIGLTPHSDAGGLTILLQVSEVEGLQVKKNGVWVSVKPLPNAFIVNVGDILEIITNGEYHSIEHRATINSQKERLSIATFYSPKFDGEMGPAKSLINKQSPPKYTRLTVEEFYTGRFSTELDGKSHLESLKLQHCDDEHCKN